MRGKAYIYKGKKRICFTCIQMYIWFCNKVYFKLCQAMVFILNMNMDSINSDGFNIYVQVLAWCICVGEAW